MSVAISGASGTSGIHAMSGASYQMPASTKMSNLFDQIDANGSGAITQAQFNQAFQIFNPPKDFQALGSGTIWSQLDPASSGSVSKQDFVTSMTAMMKQMRAEPTSNPSQTTNSPAQTISASIDTLSSSMLGGSISTWA